jgi:hypothetical protein
LPLADDGPDHRAGIELAAIDAHRAAEAAADIERGLDDGVAGKARRNWLEIRDFPGGLRRAIPFLPGSGAGRNMLDPIWDETVLPASVLPRRTG